MARPSIIPTVKAALEDYLERLQAAFLAVPEEQRVPTQLTRPRAPSPPQPRQTSLDGLSNLRGLSGFTSPYLPKMLIRRKRDEFYRKAGKDVDTEWVWACCAEFTD